MHGGRDRCRRGSLPLTSVKICVLYFLEEILRPRGSAGRWRPTLTSGQERFPPTSTLDEGAMDRRILVVDDSELVCQQLSQLLASSDRRIKVAHDGTTALEWLVEHNFSLVHTDLRPPAINGVDLRRPLRQ